MNRSVIGYHLIMTTYGFWLPNDPRGSWSDFVRDWELFRFAGPATKVDTPRSVAGDAHDLGARRTAKDHLAREPVSFSGVQAMTVGKELGGYARRSNVILHACAILPEHIHLVVARHESLSIEAIANQLKGAATRQLSATGLHPFANEKYQDGTSPSPWARKFWKCFLWDEDDMARAIAYTIANPVKEGKPAQDWTFVMPCEG